MGALSSQAKYHNKPRKYVDEHFLLPHELFNLFDQYLRKQAKPNKADAKVEPAIFSIFIDQILHQQKVPNQFSIPTNFESKIFSAIEYQLQSFISQANPFADRFRFIEDNIGNIIQTELIKYETEWTQQAKSLLFDFTSNAQTSTVLHAAFSVFFKVASIDNFEKLSVENVTQLLENLNKLVTSPNCPTILGTSPELITKFTSFILQLVFSPKFSKTQIKSQVITFLLHISSLQGGISTVLTAFTVAMSVPALTPFEGVNPILKINKNASTEPIAHEPLLGTSTIVHIQNTQVYSACSVISNQNLLLVTSRGIVEINPDGRVLQTREIKNPSDIFIASTDEYAITIDKSSKLISVYNYSEFSLLFEANLNDIDKSTDNDNQSNIIGIAFCTYLFVLIETSFYEYDLLALSLDKKSINLNLKEHLKLSSAPNFIFPGKKSVFLQCGDLLLKCFLPKFSENKATSKIRYTLSRIIPETNDDYIITASPKAAYIIKSDMNSIVILNYPIKYGDVVGFPEFVKNSPNANLLTYNSFLVDSVSSMMPQLYKIVQYIFQNDTANASLSDLQFYAPNPKETINLALNLGEQSLESTIFPFETRQQILFFSLMLLTINGRCFVSQYPLYQFEIEQTHKDLLNRIKYFVHKTIFHEISTPEIIQASFQIIKATFRYLYYPNYSDFRNFLNGFKSNPRLLALSIPFLKGSAALFYAIDEDILRILSPYLTFKNLHYIFKDRICKINSELHFLKINSITYNEKYIANFVSSIINYYTDRICFPELFSRVQKPITMILRLFTRVLVLDSDPIVSASFAESCLRLLKVVRKNFRPSSKDISTDLEFSTVPDANETTQKKIETIETPHNYEDGKDIEWKIEMNGASEIEIEFDPKCATEKMTDYLQIFDRAEGGSLFGKQLSGSAGPINWPRKLIIPSDSCRLLFHADESTNDWGIRCTISAYVPVATQQFKPDISITMINLICYAIGRSLQQAMVSIPLTELEKEYKLLLESDILSYSSSIFSDEAQIESFEEQAQALVSRAMIENSQLTSSARSISSPGQESKKISIDKSRAAIRTKSERSIDDTQKQLVPISSQGFSDEDRHYALLNELTSTTFEEGTAAYLLLQMCLKSAHNAIIKATPMSTVVERFAFAALIKQLGMMNICNQTAMELVQFTANPSGVAKPPISMNLKRITKAIYQIRTILHSSFQKSKVENRKPNSLRENYQQFATDMIMKAKFLLLKEPLLKGKESCNESLFLPALDSLLSFIVSNVKFMDIKEMVKIRVERTETRIKAMEIVSEFMSIDDFFYTSRISFLAPLINSFTNVVDPANILSISNELMKKYFDNCAHINELFIQTISKDNIPNALRLFLLRFLLFPTKMIENNSHNLKLILQFLSSFSPKTIDEIGLIECLFLFSLNLLTQNRNEDISNFLESLRLTSTNEYYITRLINLQTVMIMDGYYQKADLQTYFDQIKNATPRLIVSIFRFICMHLCTFGNLNIFNFCDKPLNFDGLIEILLQFIGLAQTFEKLPVLSTDLPIQCHQYVANELVTFFRETISQTSKVKSIIYKKFDDIFTQISTYKDDISKLFDNRALALDFLGLMVIFGNGTQPIFEGGYGIITIGPNKGHLMRITSYSPLSNIVTGIIPSKSINPISVSPSMITPTSWAQPNPHNLELFENHFRFIGAFHSFSLRVLNSIEIFRECRLVYSLITTFYCFIPIILQNISIMEKFLQYEDLESWLNFSVEKSNETKLYSISEISLSIDDRIEYLSNNEHELENFSKSKPASNSYESMSEYGFDMVTNNTSRQKYLQFSILPLNERLFSPSKFVVLFGDGSVNEQNMTASIGFNINNHSHSSCLFVGNQVVPNRNQFYYEIKILAISASTQFSIGFIDSRKSGKPYETFSLKFPSREIQSPTIGVVKINEIVPIQPNDVFGVALAKGDIYFFRNGIKLSCSIPSPHLGSFSPFVKVNGKELEFEYNFGQRIFTTELSHEHIFDFCGECFIGINSKINIETTSFRNNSVDDNDYVSIIKEGKIVSDTPRKFYDDKSFLFKDEYSNDDMRQQQQKIDQSLSMDNLSDDILPFSMTSTPSSNIIRISKGSPIWVQRIHLLPKEVAPSELILFSTTMKDKLGKIGIVRQLIPGENNYSAVLDFCDTGVGVIESLKFDIRFLTYLPIRNNPNTTFGQMNIIQPSVLHQGIMLLSNSESLLGPILTELNYLSRSLSIRMCRYTMLLIIHYLRNNKLDLIQVDKIVYLLAILLLELTNFSPSIKIKTKWTHIQLINTESSNSSHSVLFVVNPSKMSHILKMVLLSIYTDQQLSKLIIPSLFNIALKTLCSSMDSAETLFYQAPPELRFESSHPCYKLTINYTAEDSSAVGFVPIITNNCQLPGKGITVSNIRITGNKDDVLFLEGNKCEIDGEITSQTPFKGLSLALLPIRRRLIDSTLNKSEGSIHLVFSLLSLIFSYNLSISNENVTKYLKLYLLPSFLSILKNGGVLGSVFSFEIIAPLLSRLEWDSCDLQTKTKELIHDSLKKFDESISEWKKLNVAAQQGALVKMLFDLTEIDATTRHLFDSSNDQDDKLNKYYDILSTKLHTKPACIFHEVTDAFTLVTALAHNWCYPIKFPNYLLLDSFLSSLATQTILTITDEYEGFDDFHEEQELYRTQSSPNSLSPSMNLETKSLHTSSVDHQQMTPSSTQENLDSNQPKKIQFYKIRHISFENVESYGIEIEGLDVNDVWCIVPIDNKQQQSSENKQQSLEIPVESNQMMVVDAKEFDLKVVAGIENFKIDITIQKLNSEAQRKLFISHIDQFNQLCSFMGSKWNQKIDETLLKIINQNPQLSKDNKPFKLSNTQLASNSVLHEVPLCVLSSRVDLIRQLNKSVPLLLKCVDLCDNHILSSAVIAAKSVIQTSYKLELFRRRVMTQLCDDARINIRFNRSRAALHMINPTHPDAMPLLKQLIEQVPKRSLPGLKRDNVPWHVDLEGEGATDAGGPARDLFTQTCLEIMHPSTGLFVMTPNKRMMDGPNQELLIPNSHATSSIQHEMFFYSGILMSIAFISRLPQPFKFAEFVWAYLTEQSLTIEDIYSIDKPFEILMKMIEKGEMDEAELEKRGLTFTTIDTHGDSMELFPGGAGLRVTVERLSEYMQMSKKYRLREMKQQLDWLKEGITYFFPPDALFLLSPWELELIVCGDNQIPVSELKKHCRFDSKDKSSKMLWRVLESFSPEERMLFIKFATGRMGLPPPGSKWHSDLNIFWVQSNVKDDAAMPLPTATTCSSSIKIPKYSTEEWMAKKIRAAIVFGVDIDTDRQVNFADIVQLT